MAIHPERIYCSVCGVKLDKDNKCNVYDPEIQTILDIVLPYFNREKLRGHRRVEVLDELIDIIGQESKKVYYLSTKTSD